MNTIITFNTSITTITITIIIITITNTINWLPEVPRSDEVLFILMMLMLVCRALSCPVERGGHVYRALYSKEADRQPSNRASIMQSERRASKRA